MNDNTINSLKEIAEKIDQINSLKAEIGDFLIDHEDFDYCLREYLDSIDSAEELVFDTFRAYEAECKFESLSWIY